MFRIASLSAVAAWAVLVGCSSSSFDIGTPSEDAATDGSAEETAISDTSPPPGVDCTKAADGTPCASSPRSFCLRGACSPSTCGDGFVDTASEECDDSNTVSHDGCDNDCTYSCNSAKVPDKKCNDGKACNGVETCNAKHVCAPGASIACETTSPCQVGVCTEPSGTCSVGLVDKDKDGQAPSTLGTCGSDCDDTDPASFKGQPKFSTTPTKRGGFDFDCDGLETKQFPSFVKCDASMGGCTLVNDGWFYAGGGVPECGATADWITECFINSSAVCVPRPASTVKKTQACR